MALMGTSFDVPRMRGLSPGWVTPDSPPRPPPGGGAGLGRRTQHEAREARRNRPELSARHRVGGWRALEGIAHPTALREFSTQVHFRPRSWLWPGPRWPFLAFENQPNGSTYSRA